LLLTYSALVLFDIDGTLVRRAGEYHRAALVHGIRSVTGLETTTEGIPLHGMLDPVILTLMIRQAGGSLKVARESMPKIVQAAERYYLKACPALHEKHCPAVEETLARLERRGVLLGLVTGNLTRIAWRKLERAELAQYFKFGAFGEMAATRTGLAKLALREARSREWITKRAPAALVGDAPSDVEAARGAGIVSIAVRTGITPVAELEARKPDYLLRNLRDLRLRMVGMGRTQ
jgi:phosphoglycolate phosphatase